MSMFQWVLILGLALVILQLYYAQRGLEQASQAVAGLANTLHEIAFGQEPELEEDEDLEVLDDRLEDWRRQHLSEPLYAMTGYLREIAKQAERLTDCYARATHDPIELAKAEEKARLIEEFRTKRDSGTETKGESK
jgi:hypothetical protein